MATRIDSTVEHAAEDLARAGLAPHRHVMMIVLDDDDEAKLADLVSAIAEGDASGELVDGDKAFSLVRGELEAKFRQRS